MENTQIIAERIKGEAQKQGVKVSNILSFYKIDKNLVNKLAKGKDTATQNVYKIADYLGCSVDYLLGRTDSPTGSYSINGNNNIQAINGNNSRLTVGSSEYDETTEEIVNLVKNLPLVKRAKAILYLNELKKQASLESREDKEG